MAAGDDDQRVAVGRRGHQRLRGDHAARARPVFDDDALAPLPRDHIAQRAREDIDRAAGRIWHENMHRPGRKWRLRRRHAAHGRHRRRRGSDPEPPLPIDVSPDILVASSYRTPAHAGGIAVRRRSRLRPGMLTIPPIASSFGASTRRPRSCRRTKNRREARENAMAAAEGQTSPPDRPGTRWCCKRSSATTSGWCPTFPTAC